MKTPALVMQQVYSLIVRHVLRRRSTRARRRSARAACASRSPRGSPKATGARESALESFDKKLETIAGAAAGRRRRRRRRSRRRTRRRRAGRGADTLASAAGGAGRPHQLARRRRRAADGESGERDHQREDDGVRVLAKWQTLLTVDLPAINAMLKVAGLEGIK